MSQNQYPQIAQPVVIVQREAKPQGNKPCYVTCPNCQRKGSTRVEKGCGLKTWLICFFIAPETCCIPMCLDCTYNKEHYCQACGSLIARDFL